MYIGFYQLFPSAISVHTRHIHHLLYICTANGMELSCPRTSRRNLTYPRRSVPSSQLHPLRTHPSNVFLVQFSPRAWYDSSARISASPKLRATSAHYSRARHMSATHMVVICQQMIFLSSAYTAPASCTLHLPTLR